MQQDQLHQEESQFRFSEDGKGRTFPLQYRGEKNCQSEGSAVRMPGRQERMGVI